MKQYILGFLKNLFSLNISLLSLIDNKSQINNKARIHRFAKIINSKIGRYSYVCGKSLIINAEIGNFCSIASNVSVGPANHTISLLSTSPIFTEKKNAIGFSWSKDNSLKPKSKKTLIGSDVWIGEGVKILNGAKIGTGAIIGAGAVVTRDVPPYAVVGGTPAKIIKYRFDKETIETLLQLEWWNWEDSKLSSNLYLFRNENFQEDLTKLLINSNPPK